MPDSERGRRLAGAFSKTSFITPGPERRPPWRLPATPPAFSNPGPCHGARGGGRPCSAGAGLTGAGPSQSRPGRPAPAGRALLPASVPFGERLSHGAGPLPHPGPVLLPPGGLGGLGEAGGLVPPSAGRPCLPAPAAAASCATGNGGGRLRRPDARPPDLREFLMPLLFQPVREGARNLHVVLPPRDEILGHAAAGSGAMAVATVSACASTASGAGSKIPRGSSSPAFVHLRRLTWVARISTPPTT